MAGFNAVNANLTIPLRSDYRYRIAVLGPRVLSLSLSLFLERERKIRLIYDSERVSCSRSTSLPALDLLGSRLFAVFFARSLFDARLSVRLFIPGIVRRARLKLD